MSNPSPIAVLAAAGAFMASTLASGSATSQEPVPSRFRGGVSVQGGPVVVPNDVTFGFGAVEGQLGIQADSRWGYYAILALGATAGQVAGLEAGAGFLVDYTFDDTISVGAGVEADELLVTYTPDCTSQSCAPVNATTGPLYGGRLHFAWHPLVARKPTGRRHALSLGIDLKLLSGPFGPLPNTALPPGSSVSLRGFAALPVVWLGYTAF